MRWLTVGLVLVLMTSTAMGLNHGFGNHKVHMMDHSKKDVKEVKMFEKEKKMRKEILERKEKIKRCLHERMKNYKRFRALALKSGINNPEGFKYAKLYIVHGAYAILNFLNLIKVDIMCSNIPNETKENVLDEIEEIVSSLQEKITKINESTTPEELKNGVRNLREYWKGVRPKVRVYVELLIVSKLENIVKRAEIVGLRLANKSIDVDEYFKHVNRTKEILNKAMNKISNGQDAMDDVREAKKELRMAFRVLKKIYREKLFAVV